MTQVFVLGAGIVGISCALELQRAGYDVTLVDRRGPAEETSMGNAGLLSCSDITPLANPALLRRLHRLMLNRDADLLLHYPHLISLLPWLLRFLRRCRRDIFMADGDCMARLSQPSIELHQQWISEAGIGGLLNRGGALKVYRSARSFARAALERELLDCHGIDYRQVDAAEIGRLEPCLRPIFIRGVLVKNSISIRDPQRLCQAYARLFTAAEGRLLRAEINQLRPCGRDWQLLTDVGTFRAGRVVVCLGAWTPRLLAGLGYHNPIAIERGYHTLFATAESAGLTRPIFDVDGSYVMAPMDMGLRVSTGSNLVYRHTRPDLRQINAVIPRVREAFPVDRILLESPWMGPRPTVPDTLPLIGPAPRHANLWLAFAHAHMGLTLGPISGRLIANFVRGATQPFAVDAYRPARWL